MRHRRGCYRRAARRVPAVPRYMRSLHPPQIRIAIVCDNFSPHLSARKGKASGNRPRPATPRSPARPRVARVRLQCICVLDKAGIGAGASGIACGTIRNNYFQPAMRELMAHNVSVWESDPDAFSYHPVGFLQTAPEAMHADVVQIYEQQQAIGYDSVLVEGLDACRDYMLEMFSDWQAPGATTVLHEKQGGYANNRRSLAGLAAKARAMDVQIEPGIAVTGLRLSGGAVTAVETDRGTIACDRLVIAAGPWIRDCWAMLELPDRIDVTDASGAVHPGMPMWTYWALREGTLQVDPGAFTTSS